jgi:hypothetical protein
MSDSTAASTTEASSAIESHVAAGDAGSETAAASNATSEPAVVSTTSNTTSATSNSNNDAAASRGGSGTFGKDGSANDYSRFEGVADPDRESPLAESLRCKDRGNEAFKAERYKDAVTHYTEVRALPGTEGTGSAGARGRPSRPKDC